MDIRQFLSMLQSVSGPNASGEYTARCPAHDDKTASLTVRTKASRRDGKEKIYLCCHAGCTNASVIAALGVTARDLIVDPDNPRKPEPIHDPTVPAGVKVYQAKEIKPAAAPKPQIDWDHPAAVYSYTDAGGKELFQVVRYEYKYPETGKRQKTFRQRIYSPQDPKATKSGYINSVPQEIRDNALYRMPKVANAIREGKPVYVVEGEKDVETLERLGLVATCNAGGAGKWRQGQAALLAGADIIILPDNDTAENGFTGQNHALDVALQCSKVARTVRLIDIKAACPDLPTKGDITDMVQLMGDAEGMEALARQITATRNFDPNDVPFWLSPMEQAERLCAQVTGYCVDHGCICQVNQDSKRALTDFVVIPRMELTRDDGVNSTMHFVLDGWTCSGRKLGRVIIGSKDLDAMNWVTANWGCSACLSPGTATKDKISWVIKKVGQMTAKQVTEYTHTGWRKIGGKWCYLYHGGAIGMEGVTVSMDGALKNYRLDGNGVEGFDRIPYREAAEKSLRIQSIMKEEIGVALLGTAYLAPLREFMAQMDVVPAFILYLYGETGTHKSTAASLAMAHFGKFHAKNPPASFNDTSNDIRTKAFLVKDAPLLVDDFHPTSSMQEKKQMSATAQSLSRAFGDGAERGRLNADGSIRNSKPPRSVAIITGEDLPAIGASGLARFFILDIDKDDIPINEELTKMQETARKGYLQKAMRGYILWLSKQADTLPDRLHEMFIQYRNEIHKMNHGQHDRAPESVACILIGYAMMLNYFRDVGLMETETCAEMLGHARSVLMQASRKQTRDMDSEKPTRIFMDSMTELMASKAVELRDLTIEDKPRNPTKDMVGYYDNDYYYFLPSVSFGAVSKLCRDQGVEFPVSLKALYKHLRTDGILPGMMGTDTPTKNRWIDGRAVRLLWIPRAAIDGTKNVVKQIEMGFNVADDTELPSEWK